MYSSCQTGFGGGVRAAAFVPPGLLAIFDSVQVAKSSELWLMPSKYFQATLPRSRARRVGKWDYPTFPLSLCGVLLPSINNPEQRK